MKIQIATGIGTGPTKLAAFDSALIDTGIANYNLIRLSSVIPPDSKIVQKKRIKKVPGGWGDRLYVVMADERVDTPNVEAWAGIGWIQDETGKGLFAEHEGGSEKSVRDSISDSLTAFMRNRRISPKSASVGLKVTGIICQRHPVCALAVAVYQASDWDNQPEPIS